MLTLLVLWFWYLLAFALGAAAMWFVVDRVVPARSADEAIDAALSRELADDPAPTHHDRSDA